MHNHKGEFLENSQLLVLNSCKFCLASACAFCRHGLIGCIAKRREQKGQNAFSAALVSLVEFTNLFK